MISVMRKTYEAAFKAKVKKEIPIMKVTR